MHLPAAAVKVGATSFLAFAALTGTAAAATTSPPHVQQPLPAAFTASDTLNGAGPANPFVPHVRHARLPAPTQVSKALAPALSPAPPAPAPPPPPPPPPVPTTVRVYDSTTPQAIPSNAQAVAGYVTGPYAWTPQEWGAFPHATHIGIDVVGGDASANVEDVEPGAVSVDAIHGWALARQAQGQTPIIYSSTSTYPAVQAAMAGIHYFWWAAQPTGQPHGVPGSDGTQWAWDGHYDMSVWNTYALPKAEGQPQTQTVAAAPVVNNTPGAGLPPIFAGCIINAESSGNATDPDGLYGILPSTWASLGYSGLAGQASIAQQNQAALTLYQRYGLQPWYDPCTGR